MSRTGWGLTYFSQQDVIGKTSSVCLKSSCQWFPKCKATCPSSLSLYFSSNVKILVNSTYLTAKPRILKDICRKITFSNCSCAILVILWLFCFFLRLHHVKQDLLYPTNYKRDLTHYLVGKLCNILIWCWHKKPPKARFFTWAITIHQL